MMPRYYSARLVKGGPLVGVKLVFAGPIIAGEEQDRSPRWQCLVDTDTYGRQVLQFANEGVPVEVEGRTLRQIRRIDEAEYLFLTARGAWAQEWKPDHPSATPRAAVDVRKIPGLF